MRKTSYRLMCINKAADIRPPVLKADQTHQFWVKNTSGKEELRPAYAASLGLNADPKTGWTGDLIDAAQDETHMEAVHRDFLITVPPKYLLEIFSTVTWQTFWTTWKEKKNGTYEENMARNLARGRENHRSNKVSVRLLARVTVLTCLCRKQPIAKQLGKGQSLPGTNSTFLITPAGSHPSTRMWSSQTGGVLSNQCISRKR
jgi:hypothetical protein